MFPIWVWVWLYASAIWSVAVLVKLARSRRPSGIAYEFKLWDGGMLLRGKTVGKKGATVMGVLAGLILLTAAFWTTKLVPYLLA